MTERGKIFIIVYVLGAVLVGVVSFFHPYLFPVTFKPESVEMLLKCVTLVLTIAMLWPGGEPLVKRGGRKSFLAGLAFHVAALLLVISAFFPKPELSMWAMLVAALPVEGLGILMLVGSMSQPSR